MSCNNVEYTNPTIRFPPEVCSQLSISDDCKPKYPVGLIREKCTKTETDKQN